MFDSHPRKGAVLLKFCKMNGAGNDFLILNNMDGSIPEQQLPAIAKTLCERHLSIGADGLMVAAPARGDADFRMLFFNADGSMGEMCGNGARCICRYGYENGLAGEVQRIETTAGLVTGWRIDRRNYRIRLNDPSILRTDAPVEVDGKRYEAAYVELGNPGLPHAVVPMTGLAAIPHHELFALGRALCHHPDYPKGANVNFCEAVGEDHLLVRTYERGVEDFTYACGTGAGSTVAVLTLLGKVTGQNVRVSMTGGDLLLTAERCGDTVEALWLTGPTNTVCTGEVTDEDLIL